MHNLNSSGTMVYLRLICSCIIGGTTFLLTVSSVYCINVTVILVLLYCRLLTF